MVELGVNIDHVATLRQARRTYEPDPVWAAALAELGGADCITIHLREDRRHINDRDVETLRHTVRMKLNLELSSAREIVDIACKVRPDQATLVPERREEVTTEGGLDIVSHRDAVKRAIDNLRNNGISVSMFIDPDPEQIELSKEFGADAVELHTGCYANAKPGEMQHAELLKLTEGGRLVRKLGMHLHAGHGLNYHNVLPIARIPDMKELNIGHSIVSRAVFVGMKEAVREMKDLINRG